VGVLVLVLVLVRVGVLLRVYVLDGVLLMIAVDV
jgi:hypothetical protein